MVRLRGALGGKVDVPLWLPAASFGDTGAATGAVATCMAARAFERGYAPGDAALIGLSSESGERGAFGIAAARA
jgi:3-oxoacyl-[acyl-carrier-protein] synthase-1